MMKSAAICSYKVIFVVLALLIPICTAYAQQTSKPSSEQSSSPSDSESRAGNNFHSSFASAEFALDGRVIIQGAPFSAVGVKETTQVLSNGRPFVRRMVMSIYRDSKGDTRVEWGNSAKTAGVAEAPMISDAETGALYILIPRLNRATQLGGTRELATPPQMKVITPQSPPDNITQVVGEIIEPLGTKIIEGVKAEGVRVTTTIPATEIPNKQPAKAILERWYSQELRRNILIKSIDPRFGEALFRLTDIDRSEPARELFKIPLENRSNSLIERGPGKSAKLEQNMPVTIKLGRGDRISVDNRTTGRIRITGWDKDYIEARATSERGLEAVRFNISDDVPDKKIWLKADYARRDEAETTSTEPKPEPSMVIKTPPTMTKPTSPTVPTSVPTQLPQPETSDKREISDSDVPPLRSDGRPVEVDLEVSVPRYAEIEVIRVTRSNVEVTGVETPLMVFGDRSTLVFKNVGAVEARTRSGMVEVENASGLVDVVTASGQISVKRAGGDVRALSISGAINVECVRGRVNIDNTDGAITLDNAQGDVDVGTSNSDVLFTGAIREGGRYYLKSMSGMVAMSVQDKPPGFTASLSSYRGSIENDFQLKVKESSQHEETMNRRIIGSYGNGRAQITLDTFDGKINLSKLAPGAVKDCK
jgi:hypothetical protein